MALIETTKGEMIKELSLFCESLMEFSKGDLDLYITDAVYPFRFPIKMKHYGYTYPLTHAIYRKDPYKFPKSLKDLCMGLFGGRVPNRVLVVLKAFGPSVKPLIYMDLWQEPFSEWKIKEWAWAVADMLKAVEAALRIEERYGIPYAVKMVPKIRFGLEWTRIEVALATELPLSLTICYEPKGYHIKGLCYGKGVGEPLPDYVVLKGEWGRVEQWLKDLMAEALVKGSDKND